VFLEIYLKKIMRNLGKKCILQRDDVRNYDVWKKVEYDEKWMGGNYA